MKLKDISVLLMTFGIVIILCSLFDFYTYLYPTAIKNPEWVFEVSRQISDTVLLPILGITIFLLGLNFSSFKRNRIITATTKMVLGTFCALFFIFLSLNIVFYGISMHKVQETRIETLKLQTKNTKENLETIYNENKNQIPINEYNFAVQQLNSDLLSRINYLNISHIKTNIKTLITLLAFSVVYLIASIKILSLDKLFSKKRKFQYEKI